MTAFVGTKVLEGRVMYTLDKTNVLKARNLYCQLLSLPLVMIK
jgi:hypothetical protein